ncbi:Prefoldin protein, subunit 5 [Guillardia theta CCMP2712]|uniref:Prefoldin protein, subunit 5 n=1 Tax=Guillardia theta (strain CCMP2712) TaxID=905079 RepID=L1JUR5_GUITC|nr:Prefoldin protein, subunit 5 [Guillardia theta CCMP2712]EKX52286.1 Prefoldin protein, subunit 5 [Guillardia theta CCMP2712]|eukprot:XP_005839266.1 Prefoldin protein, subunit 5 [Guillardia theta CCMP2712]
MSTGSQVNVASLPIDQLQALREQLQEEDRFLTNSYSQLKIAQNKFVDSREALKVITPENIDKDILVPMTSSLYVKGSLAKTDTVLVDIGTGYYVEKTPEEADDYLKRKISYLGDNCEKLESNISEKRKNIEAVTMVLQARIRAMNEQAQPGAKSS